MSHLATKTGGNTLVKRRRVVWLIGAVTVSTLFALCALVFMAQASHAAFTPDCTNVQNPDSDPDGDFLSNLQECKGAFDETWWDTDDDGLGDAYEDSDRDNLLTHEEFKARLNPLRANSDGDGIRDDFEDTDDDKLDTWEEFAARATIGAKSCGTQNFPKTTLKPKTPSFSPLLPNSYTLNAQGQCVKNSVTDANADIDTEGKGKDIDGDGRLNERDGLVTADEFALSWDPNDPDTDGDEDLDGDEPGTGDEVGRKHRA